MSDITNARRQPPVAIRALACSLLVWSFTACAARPAPQAPDAREAPPAATAPDRPSPASASSAWPAGLAPCAKDAPAGEGCATGPSKAGRPGKPLGSAAADDHTIWNVPVGPDDPVRGPADAPVTLVVFSDFECPFCRRGADTFTRLLEAYPKDVRVVWKDLPLPMHEHAEAAAELARVARAQGGDTTFWAAHDLLYAAQPDLTEPSLRKIAEKLGMRWSDVRAAIRSARFGAVIKSDVDLSDRTDVQATPTTFVNGHKITGAQPYETVRAVVDAELARARRLLEGGLPSAQLYSTLMKDGRQIAPPSDAPPP